jgi:hypothetical protein
MLMSLEGEYITQLLVKVGLARIRKGSIVSVSRDAWESFKTRYMLDVQLTTFEIKGRGCVYIQIGSWSKSTHFLRKPIDIFLIALRVGWEAAHLSHMPKLHSLLMHAVPQVKMFGGIGDILEDDIEKMHQIASWTESRVSRLKTANGRALAEAKIEAMSHNNLVKMHVEESQNLSKRNLADTKPRADDKKFIERSKRHKKRSEVITNLKKNQPLKILPA